MWVWKNEAIEVNERERNGNADPLFRVFSFSCSFLVRALVCRWLRAAVEALACSVLVTRRRTNNSEFNSTKNLFTRARCIEIPIAQEIYDSRWIYDDDIRIVDDHKNLFLDEESRMLWDKRTIVRRRGRPQKSNLSK